MFAFPHSVREGYQCNVGSAVTTRAETTAPKAPGSHQRVAAQGRPDYKTGPAAEAMGWDVCCYEGVTGDEGGYLFPLSLG
jgi:hypothetical protein